MLLREVGGENALINCPHVAAVSNVRASTLGAYRMPLVSRKGNRNYRRPNKRTMEHDCDRSERGQLKRLNGEDRVMINAPRRLKVCFVNEQGSPCHHTSIDAKGG